MVDFARVMERMRDERDARLAGMEPAEREAEIRRVAIIAEREARASATEAPIVATFERSEHVAKPVAPVRRPMALGLRALPVPRQPDSVAMEPEVVKVWTADLKVRIEARENADGSEREVIRFLGGPTGHEAYHLDDGFIRLLTDEDELRARPRWYICAGTTGRWDACWVEPSAIEAYLRERRPELFPEAAASPRAPGG